MSYRKVVPNDPCYARIRDLQAKGIWVCDAYDHNEPGGCRNPECFKYRERCHASNDGECFDARCPQLRDGEPEKSGRHCPLDILRDDE